MPTPHSPGTDWRTLTLTAIAMLALAANPLLCRMALDAERIDPATFTTIRLVAGAAMLKLLLLLQRRTRYRARVDWRSVATLFGYMICFSFAYLSLGVGTGALILFAAVLLTMFVVALAAGETFSAASWTGLATAVAGLVYLVSPGVTAPDPIGALLMATAGVSWGCYSLLGRGGGDPLATTADNFLYCVPPGLIVSVIFADNLLVTIPGVVLAVVSGALASGLGYALWYTVVARISATHAATVQLSVPVIAAFGGVLLLSEQLTPRLLIASAATLGGIALVMSRREPPPRTARRSL